MSPHTSPPTHSAAIQVPTQNSSTRLLCSAAGSGRPPRLHWSTRSAEQPDTIKATAARTSAAEIRRRTELPPSDRPTNAPPSRPQLTGATIPPVPAGTVHRPARNLRERHPNHPDGGAILALPRRRPRGGHTKQILPPDAGPAGVSGWAWLS